MEQEDTGITGLIAAAKNGHLNVVQLLVQRGAQVNLQAVDKVSTTGILLCCCRYVSYCT